MVTPARRASAHGSVSRGDKLFTFKAPINGPSTRLALRGVGLLYAVLPVFVAGGLLDHAHVRSYPALWAGIALFCLLTATNLVDVLRLLHSRFDRFSAAKAFAQIILGVTACDTLVIAAGLHGGAALLMPLLPFLVTALFGNTRMILLAWVWLAVALSVATGLQSPATDAVWLSAVFSLVGLAIALMIHTMVRGTITALSLNQIMAEMAADAGGLQRWPEDLAKLGPTLAQAMDVDSFAVVVAPDARAPLEIAATWPEADHAPDGEVTSVAGEGRAGSEVRALAVRALSPSSLAAHKAVFVDGQCGVGAEAGIARLALVLPERSRHGVQIDTSVAKIAAALLAGVFERSLMVEALVDRANTDELTGLANRRVLFDVVERELGRHRRNGLSFTVAMIDIDHFKAYNDRFGHAGGDDLLRSFAENLADRLRAQDLLARYGGEEFVLALPDTDLPGAELLVGELHSAGVGETPDGERVTFSAGLAMWDGIESLPELLVRADANLYEAKNAGRDRVVGSVAPRTGGNRSGSAEGRS